ncbi:MAG: hypothetical protein KJO31_15925 [Gammaproteobacteria bacterium]|nr:hypothetical protein [Gammaproteobacteria bacterium]
MFSFHGDGTLTEADNPGLDPNFGGDALNPGLGAWDLSRGGLTPPRH